MFDTIRCTGFFNVIRAYYRYHASMILASIRYTCYSSLTFHLIASISEKFINFPHILEVAIFLVVIVGVFLLTFMMLLPYQTGFRQNLDFMYGSYAAYLCCYRHIPYLYSYNAIEKWNAV